MWAYFKEKKQSASDQIYICTFNDYLSDVYISTDISGIVWELFDVFNYQNVYSPAGLDMTSRNKAI